MESKLKTLSILYFVLAAFSFCGVLLLPVQFYMLQAIMDVEFPVQHGQPDPRAMMDQMSGFFYAIFIICGVISVAQTLCNLLTGIFIMQRKHRTFCLIGSGISCLMFPLGTVLGIFSLIILCDDQAKIAFGEWNF